MSRFPAHFTTPWLMNCEPLSKSTRLPADPLPKSHIYKPVCCPNLYRLGQHTAKQASSCDFANGFMDLVADSLGDLILLSGQSDDN